MAPICQGLTYPSLISALTQSPQLCEIQGAVTSLRNTQVMTTVAGPTTPKTRPRPPSASHRRLPDASTSLGGIKLDLSTTTIVISITGYTTDDFGRPRPCSCVPSLSTHTDLSTRTAAVVAIVIVRVRYKYGYSHNHRIFGNHGQRHHSRNQSWRGL